MEALLPQAKNPLDVAGLVAREQAKFLAANRIGIVTANTVVAWSMAFAMWRGLPTGPLIGWLSLISIVNLLRLVSCSIALRQGQPEADPERFLRQCWIGALASGTAWSLIFILSAIYDLPLNPYVGICISGVTAGAAINGGIHRATVLAFIIPLEFANIVTLLMVGNVQSCVLAINVLLYVCMLMFSSLRAEATFRVATQLRHEAAELAASLAAANDVATLAMQRLQEVASRDGLTGLANRATFKMSGDILLRQACGDNSQLALLLIDLDRFKAINDTFGHAAGDQVLMTVARRLVDVLGTTPMVARLGGDEFAVILASAANALDLAVICREIVVALESPINALGQQVSIGCSIGFAIYCPGVTGLDELQSQADIALYAVKSAGRGHFRGFDDELRAAAISRQTIERDLARALSDENMEVWFQPQVRLFDRRPVGFEALIRWKHPCYGWVSPPEIIAAALATNQSEALTGFVVGESCRMIRRLSLVGFGDTSVAFNVSPREFGQYSIARLLARTAAAQGVEPSKIELEITEDAIFNEERGGDDLRAIAALGVKLAVDDFGVAYSSFGALKTRKFDSIKIDRVFIQGITEGPESRALVKAMLGLANALDVRVVAEGVETAEQVAVLTSLGCAEAQGYYFAKPMPAHDVFHWLAGLSADVDIERAAAQPAENRQLALAWR